MLRWGGSPSVLHSLGLRDFLESYFVCISTTVWPWVLSDLSVAQDNNSTYPIGLTWDLNMLMYISQNNAWHVVTATWMCATIYFLGRRNSRFKGRRKGDKMGRKALSVPVSARNAMVGSHYPSQDWPIWCTQWSKSLVSSHSAVLLSWLKHWAVSSVKTGTMSILSTELQPPLLSCAIIIATIAAVYLPEANQRF